MASYLPVFGGEDKYGGGDVETGEALFPGIDRTENMLRLGFIRKTFGIVTCQLALTALVAGLLMANPTAQVYMATRVWVQVALLLASVLGLIPLHIYKNSHPLNLALLGAWVSAAAAVARSPPTPLLPVATHHHPLSRPQTAVFSVSVGLACSMASPVLVLEAVVITAGVTAALTAYTFWATARGRDFTFLGPALFASLWVLVLWGFLQLFFRPGPVGQTVYALVGALLFCGYIVFDVHLLATRLPVDDYVWASVSLYLVSTKRALAVWLSGWVVAAALAVTSHGGLHPQTPTPPR